MSKRPVNAEDELNGRPHQHQKRRKVASGANEIPAVTKPDQITSARQLQTLLAFQQGAVPEAISAIQSFKLFLDSILYPKGESDTDQRKLILRDYLDLQTPKDPDDAQAVCLIDIFQTWSFADSVHHDHLFSSTTAVLALLLRTLSSSLEFRKYGEILCKSILQHTYAKLVSHGLSAFKNKTHVISPSLRLLTELVSFDGGAFARQLYARRDYTFDPKVLARNLGLSHAATSEGKESSTKPSVRTNAVRYLLANLKFQYEGAKIDILKQGSVLRALFNRIHEDPPGVAIEILEVIKDNVLLDSNVPRSSKGYLMTDRNLTSIASLARIHRNDSSDDSTIRRVDDVAHKFLVVVCTTPDMGVLYSTTGWYPRGADRDNLPDQADDEKNPTGPSLNETSHRGGVPIRNIKLSSFIQTLKPYSDTKEQDLLLSIFKACPELVADYFPKKANFSFDPKLTATWMGYSAFLFSTVMLPVPRYFGKRDGYSSSPPPLTVVMENVLPQPLTQKVLTRCLNQSSDLITFFGARILIIALQKLQQILDMFQTASSQSQSPLRWEAASRTLVAEFCTRCPKMKDVMTLFWKTKPESTLQREAITRLLSMYYRTIPSMAVDEKVDISKPLTSMLAESLDMDAESEDTPMRLLELGHLVEIASHSPSMKWWQKPDGLQLTPFSTLLKIVATKSDEEKSVLGLKELLLAIVRNHGILQTSTNVTALDALIVSLADIAGDEQSMAVLQFLDNCIGRFVQRPIKYLDEFDAVQAELRGSQADERERGPLSLVLITVVEQWPHVSKTFTEGAQLDTVARWLSRLLVLLKEVGEDGAVLDRVLKKIKSSSDEPVKKAISEETESCRGEARELLSKHVGQEVRQTDEVQTEQGAEPEASTAAAASPDAVPAEDENHKGLHRWSQKDADEAVEEGAAAELLLCLCSSHVGIRREALTNVQKLIARLQATSYAEKEQVTLLLNEVAETARDRVAEMPLPYVAGVFAAHALAVLTDPTHFMYVKVNKYLNKGPSWRVGKLPSHWMASVFLAEPSDDDGYYKEIDWVLDLFFDSLRSSEDLNIFRARGVFERLLALYDSAYLSAKSKSKIVRVVSRATWIGGGSTTLITRAGILGWIQGKLATKDVHQDRLEELERRLYRTCDMARVQEWSHGGVSSS